MEGLVTTTMEGLAKTATTIPPRTNNGHDPTHITYHQPQPNATNPTQYHSRQHKNSRDTKPQQRRHTQPNHCQTELSRKNRFFSHKTTTNRSRNISSISETKTPPSANTTYPTNPRQYDHQTTSPRTSKTYKMRQDNQDGDFKKQTSSKLVDAPIPPMGKQRNSNPPITDIFPCHKEQRNHFTRPSIRTSTFASRCPNACSSGSRKSIRSFPRTTAPIPASPFTS